MREETGKKKCGKKGKIEQRDNKTSKHRELEVEEREEREE